MPHDVFISYAREDVALIRGSVLYHIFLSGRIVDRERIESVGEQIARSFRVKDA